MPYTTPSNSVLSLIEKEYGCKVTSYDNPEIIQVGVAVLLFLKNNPRRLSFTFINLSVNTIYIAPSSNVSATLGISITPNGGSATITLREDFTLASRTWYCISTGAASSIYCISVETYD